MKVPNPARDVFSDPFSLADRVRRVSPGAANRLLDGVVRALIPLSRGTGVRVRELDPRRAVLSMPVNRRTRNHLRTLYFGAQMTLVDLTAGVLLFPRFPPGPYGGVIRRVEAEFVRKARGRLQCICELDPSLEEAFEAVRRSEEGKVQQYVPFVIEDEKGETVTHGRVLVAVKRFRDPEP